MLWSFNLRNWLTAGSTQPLRGPKGHLDGEVNKKLFFDLFSFYVMAKRGFHLPGHRYLGPNGPINNGPPVDYDDLIAEEHDIRAYHTATTLEEIRTADQNAMMT
uniref:Capsid protein VP1 n=1 Tax=Lygus hesperus TaxID=30085 RepID=A0A0A9VS40_LYGHE